MLRPAQDHTDGGCDHHQGHHRQVRHLQEDEAEVRQGILEEEPECGVPSCGLRGRLAGPVGADRKVPGGEEQERRRVHHCTQWTLELQKSPDTNVFTFS